MKPFTLYNTLGRELQTLQPKNPPHVGLYSCGPTVYNYAHIGNLRAFLFADLLKRSLRYLGYTVHHVMNITDVDDKIIRDAHTSNTTRQAFVKTYEDAFFEDLHALHIEPANEYPRATEHIKKMQDIIQQLADKDIAYLGSDGSIYYSVKQFPQYGKLARIDTNALKQGASGRVKNDEYTKDELHDFALWKAYEPADGSTHWDLTITINGTEHVIKGRPGWHIECSAMSTQYLGNTFDLHTGGIDLIFPHHENEIAQTEAATSEPFVTYWMHNDHLVVDGKKMSKSLGNYYTLRDLTSRGHNPLAFRYLILSTHYRTKQNFTLESLDAAQHSIERLQEFVYRLLDAKEHAQGTNTLHTLLSAKQSFASHIANDLNTPNALETIYELVTNTYLHLGELSATAIDDILALMHDFNSIFDILTFEREELPHHIKELITQREHARASKDWALSDTLREQIKEQGYLIDDTPTGTRCKKIPSSNATNN